MALLVYAITLFVSAFLLFLVQPIIGQKILPKLGGTPSVWNTCVVFFQTALLVGYAYTHFTTKLPVRRQMLIHCLLLFVPFLILLPNGPFPVENFKPVTGGNPMVETLLLLATIVGIPFFVVSTTAPLLQKWFGNTGHPAAKDPYFLYGASNFGSMLSLLLYPFLFEPIFGLEGQSWFYTIGYGVLLFMVVGCALMAYAGAPVVQLPSKKEEPELVPSMIPEPPAAATQVTAPPEPSTAVTSAPPAPAPKPAVTGIKKGGKQKHRGRDLAKVSSTAVATPAAAAAIAASTPAAPAAATFSRPTLADPDEITWARRLRWIGLAAVPSSLMLGVTTYMSTDISAIPLFWVLPLALYLLSFILVFMRSPIHWLDDAHDFVLYTQPALLALLALCMAIPSLPGVVGMILIMLLAFTATALACHGEMARDRPSAKHLTEFYLLMSVGGAIGGLFNGIIAPQIFPWGVIEFGLALAVAGLLRPKMREYGWTEQAIGGMGQPVETQKHAKKKIVKPTADVGGMALVMDFALPIAIAALFALFLYAIFKPSADNYTEMMFFSIIIPALCASCFWGRPIRFGLTLGILLLLPNLYQNQGDTVQFQTRSYFGLLRVRKSVERFGDVGVYYMNLMHGTTNHGMSLGSVTVKVDGKDTVIDLSRVATTYYHKQGPVGIAMERFNWFKNEKYDELDYLTKFPSDLRMPTSLFGLGFGAATGPGSAIPATMLSALWSEPAFATIGLGTGTMATYVRPFGTLHFYEIDEQIRRLSLPDGTPMVYEANPSSTGNSTTYFPYLQSAIKRGANLQVLMGDARLRMAMPWVPKELEGLERMEGKEAEKASKDHFDKRGGPEYFYHLIVVDAFSSDAIPRHLITKQAMEMYFKHLVQGHWGPWITIDDKYDPKTEDTRFLYEEVKEGDKVVKKRQWIPGGMLCVHTSNRHLKLVPVVVDTAAKVEWEVLYDKDGNWLGVPRPEENRPKKTGTVAKRGHDSGPGREALNLKTDIGHYTSEWVIVARDEKDLKHLVAPSKYADWITKAHQLKPKRYPEREDYWTPQTPTGTYVWTDDHSNLMAVFRWPWQH